MYKNVALIILDGWGIREKVEGNAVVQAHTPNYDGWMRDLERSIVDASEEAVGLVAGQMGNSEVGHLNLGAGFVVNQNIRRIDTEIESGSFFANPQLLAALERLQSTGGSLHVIGLFGPGGVHSHSRHLFAMLKIASDNGITPRLHVITDGRDTPPESAITFVDDLEAAMAEHPAIISTLSGRYYAMDRDKRWERTQKAYDTITYGQAPSAPSLKDALRSSYDTGVTDEFIVPVIIEQGYPGIQEGDCLVFFNFRADRMRQIVASYYDPQFSGFDTKPGLYNIDIITFTEYSTELQTTILFPAFEVTNPLARVISDSGLTQFHAAETEKYAHVTYFFNGGREEPFQGEERMLVPSPKVATYDLQPEMSAYELADKVVERIRTYDDNFLIINFANPDMVGHTGVISATKKAVEAVDECAGRLVRAMLDKGGAAIVTADHGNAEQMVNLITGEPHTYHTINPVSLFVIADRYFELHPRGKLADVAPTILHLLGLEPPPDMTGHSLIDAV